MIKELDGKAFAISTSKTTLVIRINEVNKVVTEYYGPSLGELSDYSPLYNPYRTQAGRSVVYDEEKDPNISLNYILSDFSSPNKGDFLSPSVILTRDDSCTFDFAYVSHKVRKPLPHPSCPMPHEAKEELVILTSDKAMNAELELHYLVYESSNVIGRYSVVRNKGPKPISLKKLSSLQLSLIDKGYDLISFHGSWGNEFKKNVDRVGYIRYSFDSTTGSSSDYHNPLFILKNKKADYLHGEAYGFNLVYAGNHLEEVEKNNFGQIRILTGISPTLFEYALNEDESFASPIAVMTCSNEGVNGLMDNFHKFGRDNISPVAKAHKERPIVYNSWEAQLMNVSESKIKALIDKSADLGIELFVLDDGWFGNRSDETKGLGDWYVNKRKLPNGIKGISDYAHEKGLLFGLWFEPEAISPNSRLYRLHPDWAIKDPYHVPSKGRRQYTLDLTKKEVRDYLFERLEKNISEGVDFIKWDYNRTMSDVPYLGGTFYHRYVLGLYELLARVREKFPDLWMENCASGGSRNDLSMFIYFDTAWVSDDTDSYERSLIQEGMMHGYPLSFMSNHVAAKTSNQMLRKTSYGTKFDIASFGVLGYEFDITKLDPVDEAEIRSEIAYYKEHRRLFQFGKVHILEEYEDDNRLLIEVHDDDKAAVLYANLIQKANPHRTYLPLVGLDENAVYKYEVREEGIDLKKFGNMINYKLPFKTEEDSALINCLSRIKNVPIERFYGSLSGKALNAGGLRLYPEWAGDGYDETTRIIGDFGARLYLFEKE